MAEGGLAPDLGFEVREEKGDSIMQNFKGHGKFSGFFSD